jgi:AAA domain (dynein-related subfamily)
MATNKPKHNYIFYGTRTSASEIEKMLTHTFNSNEIATSKGLKQTPVCIWGRHGIGKTDLVEKFATENGYQWTYIAPAQFEEMGDLVGMPQVIKDENGQNITKFMPPSWVPTTAEKGILLIDDVNRADDRILRGIMQLIQNYELLSWKLPKGWQIILTANPDGGDYSVTPMDDAMLTRMMHVTMEFDVKEWAKWAERKNIDQRGINFVLTYPEVITGERTTPRTLTQFFNAIASIKDLEKELGLVQLLGDSCLDSSTVTAFINFVNSNLNKLIAPEEIINAKDFKTNVYEPLKSMTQRGSTLRVDILATLCTRLVNYLTVNNIKPDKEQLTNIKSFIKIEFLPNDIRLAMAQDIVSSSNLKLIMADPEIGKLLLNRM